ncbi:hypothetical protein ES703_71609 [subsurface metagenome]
MIYQVRANLYFTKEDEAKDFYHDCELAFFKDTAISSDSLAAEFSIIELIENHHDEDPNAPCCLLASDTNQAPPHLL